VFAALACLFVLAVSPDLVALFPVPVLVGMQLYMGLRLMVDWLVGAYRRLTWHEYLLVPLILCVIAFYGVIAGVVLGIVAACVTFALLYGRAGCVRMEFDGRTRVSNVERSIDETRRLLDRGDEICGACLQGFLFFGSANSMLQRIRERIRAHGADAARPVRYVVLDFAWTNGMDASVSLAFVKLRQACAGIGAELVLTALPANSRALLTRTGALALGIREFKTLDAGLEWIESKQMAAPCPDASPVRLADFRAALAPHFTARALERLAASFESCEIDAYAPLFRRGDAGDALYIVEAGRVTVSLPLADGRSVRLRSFGPGTIVGEMAVYTQAPRSADVFADEPARLQRLTLGSLRKLETEDPLTAQEWHRFVVKTMASRLAIADEALRAAS
jgi:sulfate permease, SulP family